MASKDWQCGKSMLECNQHMLLKQVDCDVTFKLLDDDGKEKSVGAHRYILMCRSPVFEVMVSKRWKEGQTKTVEIDDIAYDVFWEFLRYIYYEQCKVTTENALPLLNAAKMYMIHALDDICTEHFCTNITTENVCVLLKNAIEYGADHCIAKCMVVVEQHLIEIVKLPDFLFLSSKALYRIVSHPGSTCSEVKLYEACARWAKEQLRIRKVQVSDTNIRKELGAVLHEIRFPLFSSAEFAEGNGGQSEVLTKDEKLDIYQHICSNGKIKSQRFKYRPRRHRLITCPYCHNNHSNFDTMRSGGSFNLTCRLCQRHFRHS